MRNSNHNTPFCKYEGYSQLLHNQTAYIMQRRLHKLGKALIIMPMKV